MKFPFLADLGPERGWYRVGPLARVNNCDRFDTPLAEQERQDFAAAGEGRPLQAALATHWARLIELLYCAEAIRDLLTDPDLLGGELRLRGEMRPKGIGVLEAPRGTLFHHYEIDDDGLVTRANLIVSTTNNNQAMNTAIRQVAAEHLDGRELTEPLLNTIEVAIRAYDPCLSCATHAVGRMPLLVDLEDAEGVRLDRLVRHPDGTLSREGGG
jgi:NAD-reducing hydrogenase large subunit